MPKATHDNEQNLCLALSEGQGDETSSARKWLHGQRKNWDDGARTQCDSQEEKATVRVGGEMLKTSRQRQNHSQVNLKVSLLTRCDREFTQHSEKFPVHTVTNSYGKDHCTMKSQTGHGKRLEEQTLITREMFPPFLCGGRTGEVPGGHSDKHCEMEVKENFVWYDIPGHCQGYNKIVAPNENLSPQGIFSKAP